MRSASVRPELAARTYATLARYVLGFAIQLDDHGATDQDDTQPSAIFRGLSASLFPATVAVAESLPVPLEQEFTFGLELIVNGLSELRDGHGRRAVPRRDNGGS